jgi:hypothetical protein
MIDASYLVWLRKKWVELVLEYKYADSRNEWS